MLSDHRAIMTDNNMSSLSSEDQAEFQYRFPRGSWWLGIAHSHPDLSNTQTLQTIRPGSSFQDRYVPHPINQNRNQSSQAPSSFQDTRAIHPIDQPPSYNSIGPLPPSYPNGQGMFNSV